MLRVTEFFNGDVSTGFQPRYDRLSTCELCDGDSESSEHSDGSSDDEFAKLKPEWLPNWLYTNTFGVPKEVKQMMKTKMANPNKKLSPPYGSYLTMFDVSGPAVRWLWIATAIHWPFMLIFPFVAFEFTECNGLGLPSYHVGLWGLVAPIFAIMMVIEWICCLAETYDVFNDCDVVVLYL